MAVFRDTMKVLERTSKIETKLTGVVNKITNLLYALFEIVEKITKILVAAIKALNAISKFIRNAATALDENPLAKGPWKVVFNIAATILRGVAKIVESVAALLKALQKAARNSLLKKLDNAIEKIDEVFLTYGKVVGKAKNKLNQLMALCRLLEKQQEKIEKANPTLRKSVNKNILDPMNKILDALEPIADSLNGFVNKLDAELTRLKNIAKLLQALERLANIFRGVIGKFVNAVKSLFAAIKGIILAIPFLGWLLDKIDQFIKAAIRAVGLKAALDKLAAKLKNMPFLKKLRALASQLKDFITNLLDLIAEIEKKLEEAIEKLKKITEFIEKAIDRFMKLALSKKKLEKDLIPQVITMKELLENGMVAVQKNNFERLTLAVSSYEELFWTTHNQLLDGPDSMFGVEVYLSFFTYAQLTDLFLEDFAKQTSKGIEVDTISDLLNGHIKQSEGLLNAIDGFYHDIPELPEDYFDELQKVIFESGRCSIN